MLDIKFIRENPDIVVQGAKKKGVTIDIDTILSLDTRYREASTLEQQLNAERNAAARERNIEAGKRIKEDLGELEGKVKNLKTQLEIELLKIPNLPNPEVPEGGEDDFEIIKTVGNPKEFSFKVCDHLELGEKLDIIDVARAAKVSGTRFAYLKNEGVFLELALVQFALDKLRKEGFSAVIPPVLIKSEITQGLGYWTSDNKTNYYLTTNVEEIEKGKESENSLYLVGTAEHALVPMHADETLSIKELPKRYVGFSPAFRRESGSYGRDTRGILRVHQFEKVEMVSFVRPDEEEAELGKLTGLVEEFMSDLGLSYRIVRLAARDISFPASETLDIETWMPAQNKYRETHSISTTGQFQSRRLNIKYQDGNEKKYVSILNGTAFAIGRTIIAILENFQEADGAIVIPEVLRKYTGFDKISSK
ncbi:MAG: serine--tRNA ligase [Candidatus Levybacteria bacterium]|nr:serine--tRNA ligase [Candidatus Levybacteria bacterium]MBP9814929.1 serine--tRNA ligase [Candidatus Levybacteria bacterium]